MEVVGAYPTRTARFTIFSEQKKRQKSATNCIENGKQLRKEEENKRETKKKKKSAWRPKNLMRKDTILK